MKRKISKAWWMNRSKMRIIRWFSILCKRILNSNMVLFLKHHRDWVEFILRKNPNKQLSYRIRNQSHILGLNRNSQINYLKRDWWRVWRNQSNKCYNLFHLILLCDLPRQEELYLKQGRMISFLKKHLIPLKIIWSNQVDFVSFQTLKVDMKLL